MLIPGSRLIGTPIMSLQTGAQLAETSNALIDPSNLKIIAYQVEGPLLSEHPCFIRIADVRELSDIGMIVDSSDEFIGVSDVISIEKLYKLNFNLIGLNVIDETKRKLGKVTEYNLNASTFFIEQLSVNRGIIKSLSEPELLIHRSQILEINDSAIIVRSNVKKLQSIKGEEHLGGYLNPFRSSATQLDKRR